MLVLKSVIVENIFQPWIADAEWMHLHTQTVGGRKEWTSKLSGDQLTVVKQKATRTKVEYFRLLGIKEKKTPEVAEKWSRSINKQRTKLLCDPAVGCQ